MIVENRDGNKHKRQRQRHAKQWRVSADDADYGEPPIWGMFGAVDRFFRDCTTVSTVHGAIEGARKGQKVVEVCTHENRRAGGRGEILWTMERNYSGPKTHSSVIDHQ